jgi:hypothetical protein
MKKYYARFKLEKNSKKLYFDTVEEAINALSIYMKFKYPKIEKTITKGGFFENEFEIHVVKRVLFYTYDKTLLNNKRRLYAKKYIYETKN